MDLTPRMVLIEYKSVKFVLAGRPNLININSYIKELLKYNAKTIVKVCQCNYNVMDFNKMGVIVKDLIFDDGKFPPDALIDHWIELVENYFNKFPDSALAVHCQYGLGRSAVLIAIALIECGLEKSLTIEIIRKKRRGSFNKYQVEKLMNYESQYRLAEKV